MSRKRVPGVRAAKAPPKKVKSLALFGVVNFLPQRPPGDTDDTVQDMQKIMCDENRRLKQNRGRIEQLMTQTFADRRKLIVTDGISLRELRTIYPCLFDQEQVLRFNVAFNIILSCDQNSIQNLSMIVDLAIVFLIGSPEGYRPNLVTVSAVHLSVYLSVPWHWPNLRN